VVTVINATTKPCFICKAVKPLEQFPVVRRNGRERPHSYCDDCNKSKKRGEYAADRAHRIELATERKRWLKKVDPTYREKERGYARALRQQMLNAYGRECECCGEATEQFLTLEHVNGDGKEHRARLGNASVLRDLRRRGWPTDGFAILCMNCNWGSRFTGVCPHAMARLLEEVA
jgi:hypothetical protein